MATYKITDIYATACDLLNNGCEYADIYITEPDEDFPETITFQSIDDEFGSTVYDPVESCDIPEDYDFSNPKRTISLDDYCAELNFTYSEILTINHALSNALEYFKECEKDPQCTKEIRQELKSSAVDCRNLQAKMKRLVNMFCK